MTLRLRRAAAGAATVVLLAACAAEADIALDEVPTTADAPPSPDPTSPPAPDGVGSGSEYDPGPIAWEACGNAECARVPVPLDHDDPDGEMIELAVVRVPARGERQGALFFNPGGPGGEVASLTSMIAWLLPDPVRDSFDVVGIDPRGIGGSAPLGCGLPPQELYAGDGSVDTEEERAALLDVSRRQAEDCAATALDLLPHVGSRSVARDMDAVRAGLGDEQLTYIGFSYGTVIGQVYADLFPHRVRAMVLDGLVELGPDGIEQAETQARGFDLAVERFAERCASDPACPAGPDPLALLEEIRARAEEGDGIPAPGASRPAGPAEVLIGTLYSMYSSETWPLLERALAEADGGDGSRFVRLADMYLGLVDFTAFYAVSCLDFAWPEDHEAVFDAVEDAPGRFGAEIVSDGVRCTEWPVPPQPLEAVRAPGTPPILVISTTGDPATPHESAVAVADRLESAVLLTYEGDGHTVALDGDPCISPILVRYLVEVVPPEPGTSC